MSFNNVHTTYNTAAKIQTETRTGATIEKVLTCLSVTMMNKKREGGRKGRSLQQTMSQHEHNMNNIQKQTYATSPNNLHTFT
jgi:hypothetical protein